MAHAMRNAREGHSVTYLQSKEVPAGIRVRRQGARLGATGTGKSLSLRCELTTCRRCSELSSPRSVRISTGEGDSDTLSRPKRLCARAKRPTNSPVVALCFNGPRPSRARCSPAPPPPWRRGTGTYPSPPCSARCPGPAAIERAQGMPALGRGGRFAPWPGLRAGIARALWQREGGPAKLGPRPCLPSALPGSPRRAQRGWCLRAMYNKRKAVGVRAGVGHIRFYYLLLEALAGS